MTSHSFNIGAVERLGSSSADSIEKNIAGEKMYTWIGNLGLANVSDLLRASTNPLCTSATYSQNNQNNCNSNYLLNSTDFLRYWTINVYYMVTELRYNNIVWTGISNESLSAINRGSNASNTNTIRPVVFLKSDITLSGEGTSDSPYRIV